MSDGDIEQYLQEIGRFRLLTEEEEISLSRRILQGEADAREEMIQCNLRLVVSIAKSYSNCGLMLLDVIAEGNLGLLKAVERYNPESGRRFSTYASWWIKQTIRRALSSKVKNVRVPTYMAEMVSRWKRVSSELAQELHRAAESLKIYHLYIIVLGMQNASHQAKDIARGNGESGDSTAGKQHMIAHRPRLDPLYAGRLLYEFHDIALNFRRARIE